MARVIKPRLFKHEGEWWMEYEGHSTAEIYFSLNEKWACAIFRLRDTQQIIITDRSSLFLRFTTGVPLLAGISNEGVAGIAEYAAGGERKLLFFYPDGAVAETEPIPELQKTDRLHFNPKYMEVNLLASDGRILKAVHFGEMEATVVPKAILYKHNPFTPLYALGGILLAVIFIALLLIKFL